MLAQQFELSERRYSQRRDIPAGKSEVGELLRVFVWDVGDETVNMGHHLKRGQLGGGHWKGGHMHCLTRTEVNATLCFGCTL
jgi:hypothetical protein